MIDNIDPLVNVANTTLMRIANRIKDTATRHKGGYPDTQLLVVANAIFAEFIDPKCCVWVNSGGGFDGERFAHETKLQTSGHAVHRPRTYEAYEEERASDKYDYTGD